MPAFQRILIIRPSALGDVCRSVGVLASLRAAQPRARIDWIVQDTFADAIRAHPALSEAIPFPRNRFRHIWRPSRLRAFRRWLAPIRDVRYDLVIDAQGLFRSGFIARATGAAMRIGFADAREGAALAYTHRVVPRTRHTVDRMHELVEAAGVPLVEDLSLKAPEGETMPREVVVIAPTSRWASKRWPIDRFASVVEHLIPSHRVAIVGAGGERAQCAPLLDRFEGDDRVLDLVGRTSIADLMRLIEGSTLVVANDSAALHMAVGFDRPIVALYGPTDVSKVGPWRRETDVVQHVEAGDDLRHKRDEQVVLMERITVDEVVDRCERALTRSRARTPS